jgi:hypothetical protein
MIQTIKTNEAIKYYADAVTKYTNNGGYDMKLKWTIDDDAIIAEGATGNDYEIWQEGDEFIAEVNSHSLSNGTLDGCLRDCQANEDSTTSTGE